MPRALGRAPPITARAQMSPQRVDRTPGTPGGASRPVRTDRVDRGCRTGNPDYAPSGRTQDRRAAKARSCAAPSPPPDHSRIRTSGRAAAHQATGFAQPSGADPRAAASCEQACARAGLPPPSRALSSPRVSRSVREASFHGWFPRAAHLLLERLEGFVEAPMLCSRSRLHTR